VLISSDAYKLVKSIALEVLSTKKPHLLLFSLIFSISSLASGVKAVINSLNKAYDEPEKRPFYKTWPVSILGSIAILLIIITLLILLFTALYYFLPSRKLKLREAIPGTIISSFGWAITSAGFAYYVNNFSNFTKFYGSIDAILIFMSWIYVSSIIIILGGEVNASLICNRLNEESM
jgi:membrane protein